MAMIQRPILSRFLSVTALAIPPTAVLTLSGAGCTTATATEQTDSDHGADPGGSTASSDSDHGAEPDPGVEECADRRSEVREILDRSCARCHSGPTAISFDYITDLDELLRQGKVRGGSPDDSVLYTLIQSDSMPRESDPLTETEKDAVYNWISGCTNPAVKSLFDKPACIADNAFVSNKDMLRTMHKAINDTADVRTEDRKFIRFFTLVHLWNAGYCDDQIEGFRLSLSKMTNSLSRNRRITPPEPVDERHLVFRIDIRDYGWDAAVWDLLADQNPYTIDFEDEEAVDLKALTGGTSVPFITGDSFTSISSQAPTYNEVLFTRVLKLPKLDRAALEAALGVAVAFNIDDERNNDPDVTARACFANSGVSENNRCIERHEANFGAYWISYDFADEGANKDVFFNPLDNHLVADGGEIIFNLPNGLQGYMLVDATGKAIDIAPSNVVRDNQHDEDITNGLSCIGCHSQGMQQARDEVRDFVEKQFNKFEPETRFEVQNLFPAQDNFAGLLLLDGDWFAAAQARTGTPDYIAGEEPVYATFRAFDKDVDLSRAAAEFGVPLESLTPQLGTLADKLQKLNGGVLKRDDFKEEFAQAVCDLKIGHTKKCPLVGN